MGHEAAVGECMPPRLVLAKLHEGARYARDARDALPALVDVAKNSRSDAARVAAANSLLDRGYGKPAIQEEIEAIDLSPVIIQITPPDESNVC